MAEPPVTLRVADPRALLVERSRAAAALAPPAPPPPRKVAVVVAHGMGQQIRFETVDAVSRALLVADATARPAHAPPATVTTRTVMIGDERLQRVELALRDPHGRPRHVDVFEAYWAPLTEGEVTLRDVFRFLLGAGLNGIKPRWTYGVFDRWVFGEVRPFPIPVRTLLYLLVGVAVLLSLAVLNAVIVAVGFAGSPVVSAPPWLGPAVSRDLSLTMRGLLTVMLAFLLVLLVAMLARAIANPAVRAAVRFVVNWLAVILFVLALFAIVMAGVAAPLLIYLHARCAGLPCGAQVWFGVLDRHAGAVRAFESAFDLGLLGLSGILVIGLILFMVAASATSLWRQLGSQTARDKVLSVSMVVLAALLVVAVWRLVSALTSGATAVGADPWSGDRAVLAWLFLVAASAGIRQVLVQYIGDVAAYVQPHTIDRFDRLRTAIKETVGRTVAAVYRARRADGTFEYDAVAVVGHSLGSVVVYDSLNRMLSDDDAVRLGGAAPNADYLDVARRTCLLLTFGSPLDKTAFLFSVQNKRTGPDVREALAGTVQPLIADPYARMFPWLNIYSRWDFISGRLRFYDLPGGAAPAPASAVDNLVDPEARTLLVAHTEYWRDPLFGSRLHGRVTTC